MRYKVIPTVFSLKEDNFRARFDRLLKISKDLHIDFMDGRFVAGYFLNFDLIPNLKKYSNIFEAHLMVAEPGEYLKLLKDKGFKKIIFHYESLKDNERILKLSKRIRELGMQSYMAVNPETKTHDIVILAKDLDGITFMGVHPGKEHQLFNYSILEQIKHLRHFNRKINIQVDGGINSSNIKYIARSGANIFNSGSYVSESDNPKKAILHLKNELKNL